MRFLPLVLLAVLVFLFYWFFGFDFLRWEAIREFQAAHSQWTGIFIFVAIYLVYTIASMPGLAVLDVVGGILFGQWIGFGLAAISATLGSVIVFLAVRYAFPKFQPKNKTIQNLSKGFSKHTINYLLFLRLIPIAPFGIVNIGLGFSKVPLHTFLWTTFIGILPAAFLYNHAGAGINHILNRRGPITIDLLLNQYIVVALIGLSLLAIVPIFIKKAQK